MSGPSVWLTQRLVAGTAQCHLNSVLPICSLCLYYNKWQWVQVDQSCPTLCKPMDWLYSPWNSLGQNTGVGSLSLLQGIFPTQKANPGLPHCRQILYQLSHKGSLKILKWVDYPFSSRSSLPRNWTRVSCIAGGFFTKGDSIVWIWYAYRIQPTYMLYCLIISQVLWMLCSIFAHSFFSLCLVWIISTDLFSISGFSCWLSL